MAQPSTDRKDMQIITLTTDMGVRDHYVAAIKGAIFRLTPDARIVDVSHTVKPFDIALI